MTSSSKKRKVTPQLMCMDGCNSLPPEWMYPTHARFLEDFIQSRRLSTKRSVDGKQDTRELPQQIQAIQDILAPPSGNGINPVINYLGYSSGGPLYVIMARYVHLYYWLPLTPRYVLPVDIQEVRVILSIDIFNNSSALILVPLHVLRMVVCKVIESYYPLSSTNKQKQTDLMSRDLNLQWCSRENYLTIISGSDGASIKEDFRQYLPGIITRFTNHDCFTIVNYTIQQTDDVLQNSNSEEPFPKGRGILFEHDPYVYKLTISFDCHTFGVKSRTESLDICVVSDNILLDDRD